MFFKKSDLVLSIALILLSLGAIGVYNAMFSDIPAAAQIYYKGGLAQTVALVPEQERSFSIPQAPDVVFRLTGDGKILFERSDCPRQICVLAKPVSVVGETSVCVPNEIIIKIVPQRQRNANDVDAIVK